MAAAPAEEPPGLRVHDDQVVRLARGDQQPPVGTQRERLRTHARQLDLPPGRRENLVGRRVITVRAHVADDVPGGDLREVLLRLRRVTASEQAREENRHADPAAEGV
jgi:hypothetical protein